LASPPDARDVAQGGSDEGRIVAAFLQAGLEVERDILLALEVIRGVRTFSVSALPWSLRGLRLLRAASVSRKSKDVAVSSQALIE
jgi:hypothetical protein